MAPIEVSLKEARQRREEARALIARSIDPRVHRRQTRNSTMLASETTFEVVFHRWRHFKALGLKTGRQSTLSQIDRIFQKDVLPSLGQRSVFEIARTDLVAVLRKIERRNALCLGDRAQGAKLLEGHIHRKNRFI